MLCLKNISVEATRNLRELKNLVGFVPVETFQSERKEETTEPSDEATSWRAPHTDLCQPHPAALAPLQTPPVHRRAPDHRHRLHHSLAAPVRAQDAPHVRGRGPGRLPISVCPPCSSSSSSVPLCRLHLPDPRGRIQLLDSCFCQLDRRTPFPFSWLSVSPAAGTEGRRLSALLCCFQNNP